MSVLLCGASSRACVRGKGLYASAPATTAAVQCNEHHDAAVATAKAVLSAAPSRSGHVNYACGRVVWSLARSAPGTGAVLDALSDDDTGAAADPSQVFEAPQATAGLSLLRRASPAVPSGGDLPGTGFGVERGVLDGRGVRLAAMDGHRRGPVGRGVPPPADPRHDDDDCGDDDGQGHK